MKTQEDLEKLIESAGEAEEQPPEPSGGIPKQWLPGFIRWYIRILFLPFILFDLTMQKIALKIIRPPFKQEGKCLKRGNCCHYILIPQTKGILQWINLFWNTQLLGFYPRDPAPFEYEGKKMQLFGCRYLKKDGSCKHHFLRPAVCRKWPLIEYFGYPRTLKGCGFKAVPRKPSSPLSILKD